MEISVAPSHGILRLEFYRIGDAVSTNYPTHPNSLSVPNKIREKPKGTKGWNRWKCGISHDHPARVVGVGLSQA